MIRLVSLDQAKKHLRVDYDAFDDDIDMKLMAASALVLDFIKASPQDFDYDSNGDALAVPYPLRAACLVMLGILFKQRDGGADETMQFGELPRTVSSLLYMYRTPTVGTYRGPEVDPPEVP